MDVGNRVGRSGLDASASGESPVLSCCENSNEPSVSVKGEECLE
jgi:hypothetical protein